MTPATQKLLQAAKDAETSLSWYGPTDAVRRSQLVKSLREAIQEVEQET